MIRSSRPLKSAVFPLLTTLSQVTTMWAAFGLLMAALIIVSGYTSIKSVPAAFFTPIADPRVLRSLLFRKPPAILTYSPCFKYPFALPAMRMGISTKLWAGPVPISEPITIK
ncbi:MAG: hypothetical protein EOP04_21475, partial [Proteobacteria bacterium]